MVNLRQRLFLTNQSEAALAWRADYHTQVTSSVHLGCPSDALDVLEVSLWLEFIVSPIKVFYYQQVCHCIYGQVSLGSAGEYHADEQAGVARLSWRLSGR